MRHSRRRVQAATVALLGALLALSAASVRADEVDEHAHYVAAVEQAKGHLLASRQVYRRAQHVRAGVHASHPIHELGYRLWRPVTRVDRDLGVRVQAGLKEPGRAVDARVPAADYDATVARTIALLDLAVARMVPAERRADPRFQALVVRTLLIAIDEEYGEAIAEGRVVLEIEYQDAWGFVQRLRAAWSALRTRLASSKPDVVTAIDPHMALLGRAFAGIETPATPVRVERVAAALDGIAAALAPLSGSGTPPVKGRQR